MADRSLARKVHLRLKKTVTVASGSGSGTFLLNKPISHLLILGPNGDETFSANIKDFDSNRITKDFKAYGDDNGLLSTIWEKDLPTIGEFTVNILGASADGAYTVTVVYPNV